MAMRIVNARLLGLRKIPPLVAYTRWTAARKN